MISQMTSLMLIQRDPMFIKVSEFVSTVYLVVGSMGRQVY